MDDLVVFNPALNFESYGFVVLFVELLLESLAELLNAILDKLGVSAECCHGVE
jgi:DNA-directed RNA polymerase subunit N (RpoN/RPB10)